MGTVEQNNDIKNDRNSNIRQSNNAANIWPCLQPNLQMYSRLPNVIN